MSKPIELAIHRDGGAQGKLIWVARSGEKATSGEVQLNGLAAEPKLKWYIVTPKQKEPKPIWIAGLKGSG